MKANILNIGEQLFQSFTKNEFLVAVFASFAIIGASFANFLKFNGYPLLSPEVGLVAAGLLVLAALVSWFHQEQRYLGKAALEALLMFLIVEQNGGGRLYSAIAAALVGGSVIVRRRSALPFLGFAGFITLLVGLTGIGASAKDGGRGGEAYRSRSWTGEENTRPALLHIILDEHAGIEGFSPSNPRSAEIKSFLQKFYLSRNFRLYGRAYSEHFHTVNSIPQILNFGRSQPAEADQTDGTEMGRNAYFDELRRRGYRLHIYQSDFLDFCKTGPVYDCSSYDSARLASLLDLPVSPAERAGLIAVRFFLLSTTAEKTGQIYRWGAAKLRPLGVHMPDFGLALAGRVSAINAVAAFDGLIEDLKHAQPGDAYFAHMLLPHYPYVTTAQCEVRGLDDWMLRRSLKPRAQRESAYFEQIQCATSKLDAAIRALQMSAGRNNFIVIVHGDHGSRITKVEPIAANIGKFDDNDMLAGFSTLFAVRGSGIEAAYDRTPASVSALIKDFSQRDFNGPPYVKEKQGHMVMLDDLRWIPVRPYPLPKKWLESE